LTLLLEHTIIVPVIARGLTIAALLSQETAMFQPITMSIRIPVKTRKTMHGVVATCEFLDACSGGRSTDEALAALSESLADVFESCYELGRFDQLFRCAGYSAQADDGWQREGRYIDVRLTLKAPHKPLSRTEIDTCIQAALDRFAV
jgi:hypothetical protein